MFDLAVIGGGSGGIAAARRAAQYGAKVVLVELSRLGGTCVNVGCVPKKIMYNAASLADTRIEARAFGFPDASVEVDWPTLVERREAYIKKLNGIYEANLLKDGVTIMRGKATFLRPEAVLVKGDDEVTTEVRAKSFIIATGATPVIPDVPGKELGITSDGFFALRQRPKKIAIIGSGYVGVELAGVLHSLGVKTTIWCRKDGVLSHFDHMISETITQEMIRVGIEIKTMCQIQAIKKDGEKLSVCFTQKDQSSECHGYDHIMWCIGRSPNLDGLGLNALGMKVDRLGHIGVDEFQTTNIPGIYALGDVTGLMPLTPVAIAAGRKLADRLFGNQPNVKMDYENVPTVVFSHPAPCGAIGMTEMVARSKYPDVKIYESRFANLYYALMEQDEKCWTKYKLICVGPEERIVGLHMVGKASDEILQGFSVAIKMGATKKDFDNCVAIHPTAAEELVTMK